MQAIYLDHTDGWLCIFMTQITKVTQMQQEEKQQHQIQRA